MNRVRQLVITEPYQVELRDVELADPGPEEILLACEHSALSPGTELAVYTGTHQWLKDPQMVDWKFPFRSGYSAAGRVWKVGKNFPGSFREGDRVSYPGNHASGELLRLGHERCRLWRLPESLTTERASLACISRYGLGAALRPGITLGRSVVVLGLGVIGQCVLRSFLAAGATPVIGVDSVAMRRQAARSAGADLVLDPSQRQELQQHFQLPGAEIVVDATGIPAMVPEAMKWACDAGQVVVVGSPRGLAEKVNFYDDLHRRYLEVLGAHGNMLFEPAHRRLAGDWSIDKAQNWLLSMFASGRFNLEQLITHSIRPEEIGTAYEGLLHHKEEYLAVIVSW